MSASEALNHSWLQNIQNQNLYQKRRHSIKSMEQDNCTMADKLQNFIKNCYTLKKEVLKIILNNLNEEDLNQIREAFQILNFTNSGKITFEELK